MTRSTLPPQAYTREILAQAYDWLKDQPPSTQEMAQSADSLVSLFLSARRNSGRPANNASPASAKEFQSSLKTLAEGLKEFEAPHANMEAQRKETVNTPPQPATAQTTEALRENSLMDDPHTKKLLSDVKHQLNLSSTNEALRMLVVLGYEKVQGILPKG